MNIGDIITVTYHGQSRKMIVVSYEKRTINGYSYIVYNLIDVNARPGKELANHKLYVREDASVGEQLDMEGHLIGSEKEIQVGDYYMIKDESKKTSNGKTE